MAKAKNGKNRIEMAEEGAKKGNLAGALKDSFYTNVMALNAIGKNPTHYGDMAYGVRDSEYNPVMYGEDAQNIRQELFNAEMEVSEALGLSEKPEMATNHQVAKYVHAHIRELVMKSSLGSLEKALKELDSNLDLGIPAGLSGLTGNEEKLSEDQMKLVLGTKMIAYQAIREASAYQMLDPHRYDHLKAQSAKMIEQLGESFGAKKTGKK